MPPKKKTPKNTKGTQKKKSGGPKKEPQKTSPADLKKRLKEALKDEKKAAAKAIKEAKVTEKYTDTCANEHGGGITGAVFLIFIGVILLLNSVDVLPWNVWNYLWRFWPVLLILGGVQIIFGRIKVANLISGIIAICLFGLIFLTVLSAMQSNLLQRWNITLPQWWVNISESLTNSRGAELSETLTVRDEDYVDITKRDLTIDLGIGEFSLSSADIADYLRLQANYYEEFGKPLLNKRQEGSTLLIDFEQEHSRGFFAIPPDGLQYDFILGKPTLETDLNIKIGAGQGTLEFANLTLGRIKTEIGAGQVEINLKDNFTITDELVVDIGAGQAKLNLPAEIGFLLIYNVGAGAVKIDDNKINTFGEGDQVYKSANYDTAANRVTLQAKVGAGLFSIKTTNLTN